MNPCTRENLSAVAARMLTDRAAAVARAASGRIVLVMPREDEAEVARAYLEAVEAMEKLGRLLHVVLPQCYYCPDCGLTKADEDGCCAVCGQDAEVRDTCDVLGIVGG